MSPSVSPPARASVIAMRSCSRDLAAFAAALSTRRRSAWATQEISARLFRSFRQCACVGDDTLLDMCRLRWEGLALALGVRPFPPSRGPGAGPDRGGPPKHDVVTARGR